MNQLVQELTEIMDTTSDYIRVPSSRKQEIVDYVTKCLDPNAPTDEVSIMGLYQSFCINSSIPEEHRERFQQIIHDVGSNMRERGYGEDFNTWQEHTLLGSTVWNGYAKEPHKPIGMLKGDLSLEKAQKARDLAKKYRAFGKYFCLDDSFVHISLEPLDESGNTVRDPRVLDDKLSPVATNYFANFPARRE